MSHATFILNDDKPLNQYKLPVPLFEVTIVGNFNQSLQDLPKSVHTVTLQTMNVLPYNTIPNTVERINMLSFPKTNEPLNITCFVKIIQIDYLPISICEYMQGENVTPLVEKKKINADKIISVLFKKLPFGCILVDKFDNIILQ